MDSLEVSPAFHEKLHALIAPKRTWNWRPYAAVAAALVLAVGIGSFVWKGAGERSTLAETAADTLDIAPALSGDGTGDNLQTGGGYELSDGMTAAYYILPAIVYNEQTVSAWADYSLAAPGAQSRSATREDVSALLDGADMGDHLLWTDDLTWNGTVWYSDDGAPCAAALYADGDEVSMQIELLSGGVVPDCVVYQDDDYEKTVFQGVEITALKNMGYAVIDGVELRESRKLSFYARDTGCKLTIYGVDQDTVENLCARFARWGIVEGFDLSALQ
jgi:hypothetical protein